RLTSGYDAKCLNKKPSYESVGWASCLSSAGLTGCCLMAFYLRHCL
ncbi:MAG: hypothetical protein ACI9JO_000715, partial [Psychrobacter okhotskensis]